MRAPSAGKTFVIGITPAAGQPEINILVASHERATRKRSYEEADDLDVQLPFAARAILFMGMKRS